jgi:hypothetical protein
LKRICTIFQKIEIYSSLAADSGFEEESGGEFTVNQDSVSWSKSFNPIQDKLFFEIKAFSESRILSDKYIFIISESSFS